MVLAEFADAKIAADLQKEIAGPPIFIQSARLCRGLNLLIKPVIEQLYLDLAEETNDKTIKCNN